MKNHHIELETNSRLTKIRQHKLIPKVSDKQKSPSPRVKQTSVVFLHHTLTRFQPTQKKTWFQTQILNVGICHHHYYRQF